jgi:hypothetical protein
VQCRALFLLVLKRTMRNDQYIIVAPSSIHRTLFYFLPPIPLCLLSLISPSPSSCPHIRPSFFTSLHFTSHQVDLYGKIDEDEDEDKDEVGESEGVTDTDTDTGEYEFEEEEDDESYIDFDTEVVFEEISKGRSYVTYEGAYGWFFQLFLSFIFHFSYS